MSNRHTALGLRLRELRQRSELSSKEVADAVGVTQSHLCAIERGTSPNPRFGLLKALADFYGLSISKLVGETKDQQTPEAEQVSYWMDNKLSERDRDLLFDMADRMQREERKAG